MNKILLRIGGGVRDWQRWAPYAAVAWSLVYAALGVYWAVSGRGFPYAPETVSNGVTGPVVGTVRARGGLDRRDDGRDPGSGDGSGDAARECEAGCFGLSS